MSAFFENNLSATVERARAAEVRAEAAEQKLAAIRAMATKRIDPLIPAADLLAVIDDA
jgi:hypothetical protein